MEITSQIEIIEDLHQAEEYGKFMELIGWNVKKVKNMDHSGYVNVFIRRIGPVKICKIQRSRTLPDLSELLTLFKEEKIVMCKLEPEIQNNEFKELLVNKYKFLPDNSPLLGTKTIRVNLKPDIDNIFESFKKDCRYSIRKAASEKIDIEVNKYDGFYEIWTQSAKRKKIWIPGKDDFSKLIKVFGQKAFTISINSHAGAMVIVHKKTAFYYYAGATKLGTEKNLPYIVVWEAMKHAKEMGAEVWDFEGVYDERWPNKGWLGFSHFKKSFGGVEVEFPGCFVKWRWPFSI